MISMYLSRIIRLVFGTLYPAYMSYKAIKNKEVREYVKWMMYWIIFAIFTTAETFADMFISWFPLYYEIKIVFIIWLLSPATKGSSILYRRFVHPKLARHEKEIDKYIDEARENSYATIMEVGRKGLNVAADTVVKTAITGQGALIQTLKHYSSLQELQDRTDAGDDTSSVNGNGRATWYGGMLPHLTRGNFDPENDVDFLQRQYKLEHKANAIIDEEHEPYGSASAETMASRRSPLISQSSLPATAVVKSARSGDSHVSADAQLPSVVPPPITPSSRQGGGDAHLSDLEVKADTAYSYSSAISPRVRRPKAPKYESDPIVNAEKASRAKRARDKSNRP